MTKLGKPKTQKNTAATGSPSLLKGGISLAGTLECGQAFRWERHGDGFCGVVGHRVVWLRQFCGSELHSRPGRVAITNRSHEGVEWVAFPKCHESVVAHYLGLDDPLDEIIASFPDDPHMREAVRRYRGLRLLRQEPWETLASFIASSAKQIVQIRQIVANLCRELGEEIVNFDGKPFFSFPSPHAVASASHETLRNCKLGFRAKYLLATARMIDGGELDLSELADMETSRARDELMRCPGVGEKIANCTLLFAYGRQDAFPIDVWVERALRRLYFRGKRNLTSKRLKEFSLTYFGPNAGYAQQYLFHYVRMNPAILTTRPTRRTLNCHSLSKQL